MYCRFGYRGRLDCQGRVMSSDILTVLFSLAVMTIAEITLYCVYFHHIYRHDNNERIKRLLEPAVIRKRNRQNAMDDISPTMDDTFPSMDDTW